MAMADWQRASGQTPSLSGLRVDPGDEDPGVGSVVARCGAAIPGGSVRAVRLRREADTDEAVRIATAVAPEPALLARCLVPQLTGGYPPQLSLNNAGPYFRAYYAGPGDVAAAAWIGRHLSPGSPVVADSRDTANLRSMTPLLPREGLAPGAVPAAAFVELSTVDGHSAVAVASVGDRVLRYSFPLSCVTAGRPLVYAAGPHRLYGPAVAP